MRKIAFATGNAGKLREAQALLGEKIDLMQLHVDFDEPRSGDLQVIARTKLRQARECTDLPCIVQDSAFYIDALRGFPATFVNFALDTLGVDGILKLMEGIENRRCHFSQCLAYWDGRQEHLFTCDNPGTLSRRPAGNDRAEQWSGLWHIYIPEGGDCTLSEYTDEMLRARRLYGNGTLKQLARFLKMEE